MKRNIKNSLSFIVLLLLPAALLTILYFYFDPFQVVRKNTKYSYTTTEPNRDYISTEMFLKNFKRYQYNSFIFGSSRANSFRTDAWIRHLDNQAVPFVFNASGESLFGIYTKLKFLENQKTDIRNVLILFCRNAWSNYKNFDRYLSIKHPKVSGESWIKFHYIFFKAYFNLKFLLGYYSFIITGKNNIFTRGIIQDKGISIDYTTNQITMDTWEEQLLEDSQKYYESRKNIFYRREGEKVESGQKIGDKQLIMLIEIKNILERSNSNYKIILTPIYDQVRFSVKDKEILQNIFQNHLFDFTGENFITENDTNWYETDHFRPFIADSIMNIIYLENSYTDQWR